MTATMGGVAGLVAALEKLHRVATGDNVMNSIDAGRVVDAQQVEEMAEAALTAWRERAPLREDDELLRQMDFIWERDDEGTKADSWANMLDLIDAHVLGPREAGKSRGT